MFERFRNRSGSHDADRDGVDDRTEVRAHPAPVTTQPAPGDTEPVSATSGRAPGATERTAVTERDTALADRDRDLHDRDTTHYDDRDAAVAHDRDGAVAGAPAGGRFTREDVRDVRARQREEYGGLNWGSAFFGWLVAVGIAAILLGLLSAAGAAFGLGEVSDSEANSNAEAIGIVGGILLIAVLVIAYFFGGYVSGRMSRFDGGRQGFGTWAIGLAVTIVLAVAGALFGAEYNVLERLNLPRIPIDEGSLTAGAAIALAAVVILTLLGAMAGGKSGERYHRKIDRLAYTD